MSAPFREQIRQAYEEAQDILLDQKDFPLPARQPEHTVTLYHAELRSILSELDTELKNSEEILKEVNEPYEKWMSLRTSMTGNERTQDGPLYDEFVLTVPFLSAITNLRKYIRSLRSQKAKIEQSITTDPGSNKTFPSLVHLPKTTLPTFSGDCTSYKSFWNSFSSAVHDQSIPDSLKFVYLKQCLSGPPLNLVCALPVSDASYASAIDLLSDHYDDPEEIARALQNSLRKLPRVRTGETFCSDLRSLIEQLEAICVQMGQQQQPHNTINIQMEVEQRLPRYILDEIYLARESAGQWSTDRLRDKLRSILKRKEQIDTLLPKTDHGPRPKPSPRPPGFGSSFNPQPALTFHTQSRTQTQQSPGSKIRPKLPCLFCDSPDHFSSNCDKFGTPESRLQRLRSLNRCFKCLKTGHPARQCPSPAVCSRCRDGHPRPLCPVPNRNQPRANTHFSQSNPISAHPDPSHFQPANSFSPSFPNQTPLHPRQFSSPPHRQGYRPQQYSAHQNPSPAPLFAQSESTQGLAPFSDHNPTTEMNVSHSNSSINCVNSGTPVLLKCAHVTLFHPNDPTRECPGILLLDDASTNTYVDIRVAHGLSLPLTPMTARLGVFNNPHPKTIQTYSTSFGLKLVNGRSLIITAQAVKDLTQPLPNVPFSKELLTYSELVTAPSLVQPTVLLGGDYYYELEPTPIQRLPSGYHLIQTLVGPLVAGRSLKFRKSDFVQMTNFCTQQDKFICPPSDFFTLEGVGIKDTPQQEPDDAMVHQKFITEIEHINGRYQVKLPFKAKPQTLPLPSNFGLCWGRLRSVLSSLSKSPSLLQKYHSIISEQNSLGVIEPVSQSKLFSPPLHYLAHHPVINVPKNKVRIVYDGSAKLGKQLSLNECLFPGPVIIPEMVGLLFRFRIPKYVIICDIQKAFLQVSLHPTHRDCTRFLWLRDPSLPLSPQNLQIYRFARVAFGLTCSPFLLAATLQYHFSQNPSPLSTELSSNTYVDNILISADNPKIGIQKCNEAISLLKKASMPLQEFASNSPETLAHLPPELKLTGTEQKFLGLNWNTRNDVITFTISPPIPPLTKRSVLSCLAAHFDPCGLLVPVLLPLKIFLQSLWHTTLSWDQPIPAEFRDQLSKLTQNWPPNEIMEIPRSFNGTDLTETSYQLHCFTDASGMAMCAAVYLRVSPSPQAIPSSFLLFAKSKVKPTHKGDKLTIPRLELIAVEMGVKALKFSQSHLALKSLSPTLNLWTDSAIVLAWLHQKAAAKEIFVRNRLNVIRSLPHLTVRHVSGSENPADLGTRGLPSIQSLKSALLWWSGPPWLVLPPSRWTSNPELKPFFTDKWPVQETQTMPIMTLHTEQTPPQFPVFNLSKFSRFPPLLRVVSYFNRFIVKTDPRTNIRPSFPILPISISEIRKSTKMLIKQEQNLFPPADKDNEALALFLDPDKILRSKGRLGNSLLPPSSIEPIYLPPKSHLTRLIVYETHLSHQHSSPLCTLAVIRRQFWIPRGRRTVENILMKSCIPCRRFKVLPFDLPPFPPFPKDRVQPSPPFSATGLDFCGPLHIADPSLAPSKKGTPSSTKWWILLWVCLTTRAISLEIVPDQSVATFMLSFRKFVAKFGSPSSVYCDNAPTFHAFAKFSQSHFPLKWQFRTPAAAWKGGHYERLVALIKYHLRRVLSGHRPRVLTREQLGTIISEIETVINSRPITFDSSNPADPRPLRPIDFLHPLGQRSQIYPVSNHPEIVSIESTPHTLNDLWQNMSKVTKSFWEKWTSDYLPSLRERHKKLIAKSQRWPKNGELVLIHNDNTPRSTWPLAVILEVYTNEQNSPNTAKIKTLSGHITVRSVHHLLPLETTEETAHRTTPSEQIESPNENLKNSDKSPIHPPAPILPTFSQTIQWPNQTKGTERRWALFPPNRRWAKQPPTQQN